MGDPRKLRRNYSRPPHLWRRERITEDKEIFDKYGLKNKKEIWRVQSELGRFRNEARKLLAVTDDRGGENRDELVSKLKKLGMDINTIEDVLALGVEDLLNRRLQSVVQRKGLANTMKQARQFITHGHVLVKGNVINIPGYLVLKGEEESITLKKASLNGGGDKS